MTLFAAKFVLSPLCVVLVSMAGRRWGIAVAGALGSLPVVAGPILLVIAMDNGPEFGSHAATGAVSAMVALTAFVVVYGRSARRFGPLPSLLLGWMAFLVGVAFLDLLPLAPVPSFLFALLSFVIGSRLLPIPPDPKLVPTPPPWWDLPLRALSALGLVVTISAAATLLGPKLSGLLTPFPIITAVLAAFTHSQGSPQQVVVLFRGFLIGFNSFAAFCFVVAVGLEDLGIAPTFLLASATSVLVHLCLFSLAVRRSAS